MLEEDLPITVSSFLQRLHDLAFAASTDHIDEWIWFIFRIKIAAGPKSNHVSSEKEKMSHVCFDFWRQNKKKA